MNHTQTFSSGEIALYEIWTTSSECVHSYIPIVEDFWGGGKYLPKGTYSTTESSRSVALKKYAAPKHV